MISQPLLVVFSYIYLLSMQRIKVPRNDETIICTPQFMFNCGGMNICAKFYENILISMFVTISAKVCISEPSPIVLKKRVSRRIIFNSYFTSYLSWPILFVSFTVSFEWYYKVQLCREKKWPAVYIYIYLYLWMAVSEFLLWWVQVGPYSVEIRSWAVQKILSF